MVQTTKSQLYIAQQKSTEGLHDEKRLRRQANSRIQNYTRKL